MDRSACHPPRGCLGQRPLVEKASGDLIGDRGLVSEQIEGLTETELVYVLSPGVWGKVESPRERAVALQARHVEHGQTRVAKTSMRRCAMKVKYTTMIVRDMEESVEFYTDLLGFEVDSRYEPAPGVVITLMRSQGDAMVELIKNKEDEIGLFSVGMEVDDVTTTVEELRARGAKITMEPVRITVGYLAFCEDPNGVKIALIQHQ